MRILSSIVVALILGAISAILMAQLCALSRPKYVPPGASGFSATRATPDTAWALRLSSTFHYESPGVLVMRKELVVPPPNFEVIEAVRAGWPFHCVHDRWHVRYSSWPPHFSEWDLHLASEPHGNRLTRSVPLKIAIPGLFANSVFFGILWIAIPTTRQLRRSTRRRRRNCESCGYALSQLPSQVCPECGNDTASRRGSAG